MAKELMAGVASTGAHTYSTLHQTDIDRQSVRQTDKTEYWCRAVYVLAGRFRGDITITQSRSA